MAQNRHNMAIFCHFQAFLATPLAVRTTFMVTLGIGRTQTLVTHVGRWCGAIFALSGYLYGAGVAQNMAIFWVKMGLLWQAGFQSRNPPGNCFMSHIISHYVGKHVSGPFVRAA